MYFPHRIWQKNAILIKIRCFSTYKNIQHVTLLTLFILDWIKKFNLQSVNLEVLFVKKSVAQRAQKYFNQKNLPTPGP